MIAILNLFLSQHSMSLGHGAGDCWSTQFFIDFSQLEFQYVLATGNIYYSTVRNILLLLHKTFEHFSVKAVIVPNSIVLLLYYFVK